MAVSSTIMAVCMHYMPTLVKPTHIINHNTTTPFGVNSKYVTVARKPGCWRFVTRSSEETTATASESEESWEGEGDNSSQIQMPKGPPSLISPLNIQKAIRGIGITDVDHYANLGLPRRCSYDQVVAAYETKVKEISSQEMDEEELNKEMELLKESYVILSSEDERRLYDWSLARSATPERYTWPFEVDITETEDYGTPPPREPEDVGPTITVGYFIFGWLILSFILSIALNR